MSRRHRQRPRRPAAAATGSHPHRRPVREAPLHGDPAMAESGPLTARLNRRQCLKSVAAAGTALFAPTIIPASALGRGGAVAPSERIVLGGIGLGARGEFDLKWMLAREGRPVRRDLRRPEGPPRGHQADRRQALRQLRLPDVSRDARVPRDPAGHRRGLDRHGRPLALPGDDHGDAGGQGRLFREALVHDDRRGPGRGRDGAAVRADLPDRRPAARARPTS